MRTTCLCGRLRGTYGDAVLESMGTSMVERIEVEIKTIGLKGNLK